MRLALATLKDAAAKAIKAPVLPAPAVSHYSDEFSILDDISWPTVGVVLVLILLAIAGLAAWHYRQSLAAFPAWLWQGTVTAFHFGTKALLVVAALAVLWGIRVVIQLYRNS